MLKLKLLGSLAGIATGVVCAVLAVSLVAQVLVPSSTDSRAGKVVGISSEELCVHSVGVRLLLKFQPWHQ